MGPTNDEQSPKTNYHWKPEIARKGAALQEAEHVDSGERKTSECVDNNV